MKEILIVGITVIVFDIILIVVHKLLKSQQKEVQKYLDLLPGYNCNACGFGSCRGMAEAMVKDKMNYQKCKPLRGEKREVLEKSINI